MNIIFYFLFIFGLQALNVNCMNKKKYWLAYLTENDIDSDLKKANTSNMIDSKGNTLVFSSNEWLGATDNALVKKGKYNDIEVAIKITWKLEYFESELKAFTALNAIENTKIEDYGIPRIYYHGIIIGGFHAIAMTLFDGTLEDRFKIQDESFSEFTITSIMAQAVSTLSYLADKGVVHNDLKPENIFFKGSKVFIGDFGLATLRNTQNSYAYNEMFCSSSIAAKRHRFAIDDLESLFYCILYVSGVPNDTGRSEGYTMYQCERVGSIEEKMWEKCSNFKQKEVKTTFHIIGTGMFLPREKVPNYGKILNQLNGAIAEMDKTLEGPVEASSLSSICTVQ